MKLKSKELIVKEFDEIAKSQQGAEFLNKLPFDEFYELVNSDNLNVTEEINVVKIINKYLTHKATFPPLPQEDPL